jgi:hypothetical protein
MENHERTIRVEKETVLLPFRASWSWIAMTKGDDRG